MNIIIENSQYIEFGSLEDLAKIIPSSLSGKAVNYGQGEGQVQIEETIWGLYVGENGKYTLQYEEGIIDWRDLQKMCDKIFEQIKISFGSHLNFCFKGKFEDYEPHEKYL